MTINKQQLRELASNATPGPWRHGNVERQHVFVENRRPDALGTERVLLRMNEHFASHEVDAAYIAAASPSTVLALLDEIERLRKLALQACSIAARVIADVQILPSTDSEGIDAIRKEATVASVTVDGLVYGEHMIRVLEVDLRECKDALHSIAHTITCGPANYEDLVDAVRLVKEERDRLHATLKAVADVCIDKGGLRIMECVAEDVPPKAVAKIIEQRDAAIKERDEALGVGRATYTSCPQCGFAEVDLATIDSVQGDAEAKTAEAIAVWLDEYNPTLSDCRRALSDAAGEPVTVFSDRPDTDVANATHISFDNTCLVIMHAIRAGAWRKS